VGIIGMKTREDDAVRHLVVADTHEKLIFFTDRGRCFQVKTYEVTDETRQAKGESIMQLLQLDQKERITAVVRIPPQHEQDYMVVATKLGEVKKTPLKNFANVRRDGLIAMDLEPADELVSAKLASDDDDIIVVSARGQAVRFPVKLLRSASRLSGGVRGIRLAAGDRVVGMENAAAAEALLVVSEFGFGKRTKVEEYPVHGRGGQGVRTFKTNPKTGELMAARTADPTHELMLIAEDGIVLRTPVEHISSQGRSTQGVTLMDVDREDRHNRIAAVAIIDMEREYDVPQDLPTGATVAGEEIAPEPAKPAGRGKKPESDGSGPENSPMPKKGK
jgi:DNA gyrase subunit A